MKLYVGSRDYKPEGFKTVDIDVTFGADIVADITRLHEVVDDSSCDEVVAGHVLEHLDWPESFLAMMEFRRALRKGGRLRVAVPDMGLLLRMLLNSGASDFYVMGMIYGCGGRTNRFEQHRYGFTAGMMVDILETLGFTDFDWWNSDLPDGSNGWIPQPSEDGNVSLSLNISCTKSHEPLIDTNVLYQALVKNPLADFLATASVIKDTTTTTPSIATVPRLYQRIHMKLIEARQRIAYLEGLIQDNEAGKK